MLAWDSTYFSTLLYLRSEGHDRSEQLCRFARVIRASAYDKKIPKSYKLVHLYHLFPL